jgi:hypothetical protein
VVEPAAEIADDVRSWLLGGDVAVQYAAHRDLFGRERPDLRGRIPGEGDAKVILDAHDAGRWGEAFYGTKWTSPHYSLLELRDLGCPSDHPVGVREVAVALERHRGADDGLVPTRSVPVSDVCMNGMFLAFACHFRAGAASLHGVVDFVLEQQLDDGGFNCLANRSGARVASVHSTTSVVDGLGEYLARGYPRRADEVRTAVEAAVESLLVRRLYQQCSSGEPISDTFTRLHHPARWHFDVLRGLDVIRASGVAYDARLDDAVRVLARRRRRDGRWSAAAQYPGRTHVAYPPTREPNRWVTLRALRVMSWRGHLSWCRG